eukprot:GHVU01230211.1.p3 GENE.GHVU01230211.1~~GHVU01230211.1.p3  ORF type:complete len:103 (-),score=6.25 GHVU01230211.1:101-409(-)
MCANQCQSTHDSVCATKYANVCESLPTRSRDTPINQQTQNILPDLDAAPCSAGRENPKEKIRRAPKYNLHRVKTRVNHEDTNEPRTEKESKITHIYRLSCGA